jgi:uncharacterized protein DUF6544
VRKGWIGAGAAVAAAGGLVLLGSSRWRRGTAELVARLRRASAAEAGRLDVRAELERLPPPVARYLRAVLPADGSAARYARVAQRGTILMGSGADGWRPFEAVEHFAVSPPGFVWDARIRMGPGLYALVRDSVVEGRGTMLASVLGLWRMVDARGTPAVTAGALQRYLAEGVWLPTALLPSRWVRWASLDAASACATVRVGATTVSLDFHFGGDGLVSRIYTAARERDVGGGRSEPTPWQGRFAQYEWRGGMCIPISGEVEWVLPNGPLPCWRGEIVDAVYE